jgi:uncharacterized membrane protein YhaH (DUF805 family)
LAIVAFWLFQMIWGASAALERLSNQAVQWRVSWAPFSDYFYRPFVSAMASIVEVFAWYGLLALTTAALSRRLSRAGRRGAVAVVVATTVLMGGLGVVHATGRVSLSDLILALAAVPLALRAYRAVTDEAEAGDGVVTGNPESGISSPRTV